MARPHLFGRYVPPKVAQNRQNATFSLRCPNIGECLLFSKADAQIIKILEKRAAAFGQERPLRARLICHWTRLKPDEDNARTDAAG